LERRKFISAEREVSIEIRGTFDGEAARVLTTTLASQQAGCVVDFAHASDIKLHALGALLLGLDRRRAQAPIYLRGLTSHHVWILRSFGYDLGARDQLSRSANLQDSASRIVG
jgi:hypothetical protein